MYHLLMVVVGAPLSLHLSSHIPTLVVNRSWGIYFLNKLTVKGRGRWQFTSSPSPSVCPHINSALEVMLVESVYSILSELCSRG